jgi:sodium transport system permease protein
MSRIFIIFKKELIDTIRDRRAIFFMLVFPLIIFPLLISGVAAIQSSIMQKEQNKVLRVAMIGDTFPPPLLELFNEDHTLSITTDYTIKEADSLIRIDSLDIALAITSNFIKKVENNESGIIHLHIKTEDESEKIIKKRITDKIVSYSNKLSKQRLIAFKLTEEFIEPVKIIETDLASAREKLGKTIGGMLPYIFILFCFMGAMYPAIDLGAGEKERGTLETLLVAPATRMEILSGKFWVITLSGLFSATISLVGIFVSILLIDEIPKELFDIASDIIQPTTILLILSLMIPIALLFAALLLILSIYAKSFKEAQSIISPLNIIIIFPLLIGSFVPGIHLDITTAVIPIINISLACKEAIAGTGKFLPMILVYLSSLFYALLGIYACSKWFQREDIIFRD